MATKKTNKTDKAGPRRASATGSADNMQSPLRVNVIRVVLQVSDTDHNQKLTLAALESIRRLGDIEGAGVLKRELITIVSMETAAPKPNDPSSATTGDSDAGRKGKHGTT